MSPARRTWLSLIISLPTRTATARMRVWRALKALGCGVLRDGVYLLPQSDGARQALRQVEREVEGAGGQGTLAEITATDEAQELAWRNLFDRARDYARLVRELQALRSAIKTMPGTALARKIAGCKRSFAEVSAIDFFPGPAREQAQSEIEETERAVKPLLYPGEPNPVAGTVPHLRRTDFKRRTWATRKRPWVDRLASAWLIKRFIDREARFIWIDRPRDCPRRAVGFDFDGATFTHVGSRVTFEVLLAAFGLDADRALNRLAMSVRYLDVGGIPAEDAAGLSAVLSGARSRLPGDDQLLSETIRIFDFVYAAYKEDKSDA